MLRKRWLTVFAPLIAITGSSAIALYTTHASTEKTASRSHEISSPAESTEAAKSFDFGGPSCYQEEKYVKTTFTYNGRTYVKWGWVPNAERLRLCKSMIG